MLANLAAFGVDRRLHALAQSFDATYTRYADDLAFSGGDQLARAPKGLIDAASDIVHDEGFWINRSKSRVLTQTQRQVLAGLVVNKHLNVHRRDYDQLKAVLHEARVHGPTAANRADHPAFRAHLEGRIGFVQATNPQRAIRLWREFDRIVW